MIKSVLILLIGYSIQATTILGGAGANRYVVAGGGGASQFVVVSTNSSSSAGVAVTTWTVTNTVNAGNLVAIWVKHESSSTTLSISDGTSSLTGATYSNNGTADGHGQWFYKTASLASGTVTYTLTLAAARDWVVMESYVFSYGGTCNLDLEKAGTPANNSLPTTGNYTTTGTLEVSLGGSGWVSADAITSLQINGVAADKSNSRDGSAAWYRIVSATFTGAATGSFSGSNNQWVCNAVSFKAQ